MTGAQTEDPSGGLTAVGRAAFNQRDGSHLKPGLKGKADTPSKMRRKGSFLRRHFATLRGPLVDEHGDPTRLALQAHAWGEPVPKTVAAAKKLAEKGHQLLERYAQVKADQSNKAGGKRKKKKQGATSIGSKTVRAKKAPGKRKAKIKKKAAAKKGSTGKKNGVAKKKAGAKRRRGLYDNMNAAKKRAAHGGRPTRRKGEPGAPSDAALRKAARTAKRS